MFSFLVDAFGSFIGLLVTCRHEKQIKCQQVLPQAAAEFAQAKKALKTRRIIIMALLVCQKARGE